MAQLDNATDSDSGDRGFKSLRAGQNLWGTKVAPHKFLSDQCPLGFEGDRAERSEVKTSQCDVFRPANKSQVVKRKNVKKKLLKTEKKQVQQIDRRSGL